jgi:hypothetical protein
MKFLKIQNGEIIFGRGCEEGRYMELDQNSFSWWAVILLLSSSSVMELTFCFHSIRGMKEEYKVIKQRQDFVRIIQNCVVLWSSSDTNNKQYKKTVWVTPCFRLII